MAGVCIHAAVPVEAARAPKLQVLGNRVEATQYKVPVNWEEEERDRMPLTGNDSGTSGGHKRDSIPSTCQDIPAAGITDVISSQTVLL